MAATFRVTSSSIIRTAAERRLPSTDSVLTMLKWVEHHLSIRELRQETETGLTYRRPSKSKGSRVGVKTEMSYIPKPSTPEPILPGNTN